MIALISQLLSSEQLPMIAVNVENTIAIVDYYVNYLVRRWSIAEIPLYEWYYGRTEFIWRNRRDISRWLPDTSQIDRARYIDNRNSPSRQH